MNFIHTGGVLIYSGLLMYHRVIIMIISMASRTMSGAKDLFLLAYIV